MFSSSTFWESYLLQLQRDTGNRDTDCIKSFIEMQSQYGDLEDSLLSDTSYYAGLAAKGQGAGSEVGYAFDKAQKYINMATITTNVYNNCDVDYYMEATSKAVGNVSGFSNQIVNTAWRAYEDQTNFNNLAAAVKTNNAEEVGKFFGIFTKDFLMAEIPDKSATTYYTTVGQVNWATETGIKP